MGMFKLQDMKIKRRLITAFVIVLVITTIGSVSGAALLRYADNKYSFALERYGFAQGDIGIMLQKTTECKSLTREIITAKNTQNANAAIASLDAEITEINSYLSTIEATLDTDEEISFFKEARSSFDVFSTNAQEIERLISSGDTDSAQDLYTSAAEPALEACITSGSSLMDTYKQTGNVLSSSLTTQSFIIMIIIIIIIIISIVISLILATKVADGISQPINNMLYVAQEISKGNLSVEVKKETNDEVGDLSLAFEDTIHTLNMYIKDISQVLTEIGNGNLTIKSNVTYQGVFIQIGDSIIKILQNLNDTLGHIQETSVQVASGSHQIAAAGQNISEGAMEQAGAVEELNASINEVANQVENTAKISSEANHKADIVTAEVAESNQKMQEMLAAMENINDASSKINTIMKTISDIATETNLLSLNAAIEAARAGDAGKGFAVVANEIGALATQSSEAVKNTSELIETTLHAVTHGSQIADATAQALSNVVSRIDEVNTNIETITESANKQAVTITEIQQAVEQISGVVQSNSATAQESAASSEELSSQSQILSELIQRFRIAGE